MNVQIMGGPDCPLFTDKNRRTVVLRCEFEELLARDTIELLIWDIKPCLLVGLLESIKTVIV